MGCESYWHTRRRGSFDCIGSRLGRCGIDAGPSFSRDHLLFKHVLEQEPNCFEAIRCTKPKRVPTVMGQNEVTEPLDGLQGVYKLMGQLMYGAGLRLGECLQPGIKDIDFDQNLIMVPASKGKKDCVTPLPHMSRAALQQKMRWRHALHQRDLKTRPPRSTYRMPWIVSIRPHIASSLGNPSSLHIAAQSIHALAGSNIPIFTKIPFPIN